VRAHPWRDARIQRFASARVHPGARNHAGRRLDVRAACRVSVTVGEPIAGFWSRVTSPSVEVSGTCHVERGGGDHTRHSGHTRRSRMTARCGPDRSRRYSHPMKTAALVLNFVSAVSAFGASVFWFRSAGDLPPMRAYWGQAPPTDPFIMAIQAAARNNRWAALLAGVSALCSALAFGLGLMISERRG
jgi:hypothetical protein